VRVGQKARITLVGRDAAIESSVSYVSPQVQEDTQSMLVRVTLDNKDAALKPGSFVEAEILTDSVSAAVAVKREAVQTYEDRPVVFVRDSGRFEPRHVKLGASGLDIVQVLHGLKAGESYATVNSFIVKAELLKSTAEHVH
jgi:cobalt-zinc-cadmium efflux system membrane fusion protein